MYMYDLAIYHVQFIEPQKKQKYTKGCPAEEVFYSRGDLELPRE